jgi:hypothetical protein
MRHIMNVPTEKSGRNTGNTSANSNRLEFLPVFFHEVVAAYEGSACEH